MKGKTPSFTTRFGFYLAALASAFGLGNLWRFPYIVAENGGGAFVLLYLLMVFVVGFSVIIAELMLGRLYGYSLLSGLAKLSKQRLVAKKPFPKLPNYIGYLAMGLATFVLAYYAVISGWVLHFAMQFFVAGFRQDPLNAVDILQSLRGNGWLQLLLASVHLIFVSVVVSRDFDKGLEKWMGSTAPIFVVFLVFLIGQSLDLATAPEALRFLLYPDFSKLGWAAPAEALGHVLFTLSLGFGTMVTFGGYLSKATRDLPSIGFRVASLDAFVSIVAGLLVFPIFLAGPGGRVGPELLFQTVPVFLGRLQIQPVVAALFFFCLYFAALGASISLLETVVSNVRGIKGWTRTKSTWVAGAVSLGVAVLPSLSSSVLQSVEFQGRGVLELLDGFLINWLLPMAALGICFVVRHGLSEAAMKKEFIDEQEQENLKMFRHWRFILGWVTPGVILISLLLQALGLFY